MHNTTYTAEPGSEEKENAPFTPYYKRMSTLLHAGLAGMCIVYERCVYMKIYSEMCALIRFR